MKPHSAGHTVIGMSLSNVQRALSGETIASWGKLANILFLGGVGLKVPGLSIGVDLAMLLKYSGILSGSAEVLSDNGIYAVP